MFELVQVVLHAKASMLCKCSVGHDESRLNMCMLALLVKCCAQLCMCMYMVAMASRLGDDVTYLFGKGHDIFYACVWVLVLQLVTVPPLFFTGSWDKTVRIWYMSTMQQVAQLEGHTSYVTSVAFDGSGKYLASGEIC